MKRILIVRHAKSVEAAPGEKDFDRSLSERGKKDAADIARRLAGQGTAIDLFVSSPAKRTRKTAKAFIEAYGRMKNEIREAEMLYNAPAHSYAEVIASLPAETASAAIFGHNPGISDYVNSLCRGRFIDSMPTCAVFCAEADVNDWSDFGTAEKTFVFYEYPVRAFEGLSD